MKTILKYGSWAYDEIDHGVAAGFEIHRGAKLLCIGVQKQNRYGNLKECICLWYEVDDTEEKETKTILVVGTGQGELPAHLGKYLGTAIFGQVRLVYHLYEYQP